MEHLTFEEFKDSCIDFLSGFQKEFLQLYDINSYPEWYYDQGPGIFQFKSEKGNLYFRYLNVGTFSRKSNTWKWSWNNAHTLAKVKEGMGRVRAFGQERDFEPLTTGLTNGDEYTGWAMTAVAAKILSAMGSYRVVCDDLEIYFVFTAEVDADQYEKIAERYLECDEHGSRRVAFVCHHLIDGTSHIGFHEPAPAVRDQEEDYEAWCDACEKMRESEGEWNETSEAFADIQIVCEECFFEIRERNLTAE